MGRSHGHPVNLFDVMRSIGLVTVALALCAGLAWGSSHQCSGGKPKTELLTGNSTFNATLGEIKFSKETADSQVKKIGNATQLKIDATKLKVTIGNANNSVVYRPDSLLLLFGRQDSAGSQHQLDGRSFPLEAQLQLRSSGRNATLAWVYRIGNSTAATQLAEVARLLGLGNENATDLSLTSLLPTKLGRFFRYECDGRQWTVLAEPLEVSAAEITQLRALLPSAKKPGVYSQPQEALRSFSKPPRTGGHQEGDGNSQPDDGKWPGAAGQLAASPLLLLALPLLAALLR